MLDELFDTLGERGPDEVDVGPERLKELARSLTERKATFKPHDVVRWKDGLKNKRSSGPFVVVEVLEAPVYDDAIGGGSGYFREPLDIIVASVDRSSGLICYHLDSRRLEPAE